MAWPRYESRVDRLIREAQERGEFDNLPGAGKPLGDLGDPNDPNWWVKGLIEREHLDISSALPTPLALRKEAAGYPESLADVRSEAQVREVLEDYNRRVRIDRLRPVVGDLPPLLARTVDVEAVVEQWRALRSAAESTTAKSTTAESTTAESTTAEEPGGYRAGTPGDPSTGAPRTTSPVPARGWSGRWWTRRWGRRRR